MGRDRAAYMREYRARQKTEHHRIARSARLEDVSRIAELEEEVRHLKAELAKRQPWDNPVQVAGGVAYDGPAFTARPFTPVPKPAPRKKR